MAKFETLRQLTKSQFSDVYTAVDNTTLARRIVAKNQQCTGKVIDPHPQRKTIVKFKTSSGSETQLVVSERNCTSHTIARGKSQFKKQVH